MAQATAEKELSQATVDIVGVELKRQGCRKAKDAVYVILSNVNRLNDYCVNGVKHFFTTMTAITNSTQIKDT